jgi:hypothetical protein
LNYLALAACEGPIHVYHDFSGLRGMEFAANWGLDCLKKRIMEAQAANEPKPIDKSAPANKYRWQVGRAPACFDFFAWLVMAEIYRLQEKAPAPLRVGFDWGPDGKDRQLSTSGRRAFYNHVIIPGLALIGAVEDESCVTEGRVVERYTFVDIVRACRLGHDVPLLKPSAEAWTAVGILARKGAYVTITLREAAYSGHRNSNMDQWLPFAEYLTANGERVIFVRDTRYATEGITGYETCPAASIDIDARCALYEGARTNIFVANGPWSLALFGTRPWLMFCELSGMDPYPPNTDSWWRTFHGIGQGEQFPWAHPTQRVVWQRDTFANLVKAWEELEPLLALRQAAE